METALEVRWLCRALLLGGALGVVYDLMRVVRRRLPVKGVGSVLDLSFWVLATVSLFLFSGQAWAGRVRLYGGVFCMMGASAYFWGLSHAVLGICFRLADMLGWILGIMFLPARGLGRILKRIGKNVKYPFSFKKK